MSPNLAALVTEQQVHLASLQSQIHMLTNALICTVVALVVAFAAFAIQSTLHDRRIKALEARILALTASADARL